MHLRLFICVYINAYQKKIWSNYAYHFFSQFEPTNLIIFTNYYLKIINVKHKHNKTFSFMLVYMLDLTKHLIKIEFLTYINFDSW